MDGGGHHHRRRGHQTRHHVGAAPRTAGIVRSAEFEPSTVLRKPIFFLGNGKKSTSVLHSNLSDDDSDVVAKIRTENPRKWLFY